MTTFKAITVLVAAGIIGVIAYVYVSSKPTTPVLQVSNPNSALVNAQFTAALKQGQNNEQRNAYESVYDEYGFLLTSDIGAYGDSKLLFEENGYSYIELLRETEGAMPIVRASTSSKEYTGLTLDITAVLSPDKRKFAFIQDSPAIGVVGRLCVAQINPKHIECISPSSSTESYAIIGGDYEQLFTKGKWISNDEYQYSVYSKDASARAAAEGSQPVRIGTFIFK